ncbi:MAG: low affinity iron permease family protein [Betaproteobacteria bacterium]
MSHASMNPSDRQDMRALHTTQDRFRQFAHRAALGAGSPWAFAGGVALILIWAATGHWFEYSEGWQLIVNTGTTIITFLMVFVIQNTQTRDSREVHVKLDELLRAVEQARTRVILSEELSDEELERLQTELRSAAQVDQPASRRTSKPPSGSTR